MNWPLYDFLYCIKFNCIYIDTSHKKKERLHNGQKKKDKGTTNDLQNIHIKLKIE